MEEAAFSRRLSALSKTYICHSKRSEEPAVLAITEGDFSVWESLYYKRCQSSDENTRLKGIRETPRESAAR